MPFKLGNHRGRDVAPEVTIQQRYLWFFTNAYKRRAKRKKLEVTLSNDQFIELVTKDCHYCGKSWRLEYRVVNKHNIQMLTIDRKNSKIGYIYTNCVPSCKSCNTIKMDMNYDEFKAHITRIHSHPNL